MPRVSMLFSFFMVCCATCVVSAQGPAASPPVDQPPAPQFRLEIPIEREHSDAWKKFSELSTWDDGFSEMSYYDATRTFYGKPRKYTRVHLFNRQDMDRQRSVKAGEKTTQVVPAFKFLVAEEIPTDNYNYRLLTSSFFTRPGLDPMKLTVSSQEWCGTTFKWLNWARPIEYSSDNWSLDVCWYSYHPDEGDGWWPWPRPSIDAHEFLPVYARAVVASGGEKREMHLLPSMQHTHRPDPMPIDAVLRVDGKPRKVTVPLGSFEAQRVVVDWKGEETWFDVETAAPYRLLAFKAGDSTGKLKFVERRAYWDQKWKSGFYKPNMAP